MITSPPIRSNTTDCVKQGCYSARSKIHITYLESLMDVAVILSSNATASIMEKQTALGDAMLLANRDFGLWRPVFLPWL